MTSMSSISRRASVVEVGVGHALGPDVGCGPAGALYPSLQLDGDKAKADVERRERAHVPVSPVPGS